MVAQEVVTFEIKKRALEMRNTAMSTVRKLGSEVYVSGFATFTDFYQSWYMGSLLRRKFIDAGFDGLSFVLKAANRFFVVIKYKEAYIFI